MTFMQWFYKYRLMKVCKFISLIDFEGEQSLPPQNIPFGDVDYFQERKDRKRTFDPPYVPKGMQIENLLGEGNLVMFTLAHMN